ncbi:hypothetical protein EXIGLDRAFT_718905 [Exidia glandulosa HHB12029]|uniref:GH16 domain-containing protein n=1 Tax=Exidia glandulosa HHB12029 TaxID=1314781 RepID=A0A166MFL6_EXIGL|nr:hypothetical protein EXIGLDRAFT_718905 [Exidia glandulosa HHB12029]
MSPVLLLSLFAPVSVVLAATYDLKVYSGGSSFFDAFTYTGTYDTAHNQPTWDAANNGDDWFANKTYAQAAHLTSINDAGNAMIRVDYTNTTVYNNKRYSVRIESSSAYGPGSVFVLDAVLTFFQIPFGCSVWPAYWTTAVNKEWPEGGSLGEIDILENVNQATSNQMALHTKESCLIPATSANAVMSGTINSDQVDIDCKTSSDPALNEKSGCVVHDPSEKSFGKGFNDAQGGMWVTEFAADSISIWFFSRADIPSSLSTSSNATSIDTSTLGTPVARYQSSSGCNISSQFTAQKIIIGTSLCGDFGRATFDTSCPGHTGVNPCYDDIVRGPPEFYEQAYFEIVSHRVFASAGSTQSSSTPGNGTTGTTDSGGSKTDSGNGSQGDNSGSGDSDETGAAQGAPIVSAMLSVAPALLAFVL